MKGDPMTQAATASERVPRRRERTTYELDDGISIRCVNTAERNGFTRRMADGCQIDLRNGGGTVGCPDCPYKQQAQAPRVALQ